MDKTYMDAEDLEVLQLISKPLQGMYPNAERPGEIYGETFARVRAQMDNIEGIIRTEH